MMLFMTSPAFPLAVDSIHVGFQTGTIGTPADKTNARIRAPHAA
jgi:hypothetical protein